MAIDVVKNRDVVAFFRASLRIIPFGWSLYTFYWKFRRFIEKNKKYSKNSSCLNFGDFSNPSLENPVSQLCTSNQLLSKVYDNWCKKIQSPPRFSRKQWEFIYILQAMKKGNLLQTGKNGLGFGCGREPLAGLLGSFGCNVTATDLDFNMAKDKGWVSTKQHSQNLNDLFHAAKTYISKDDFYKRVNFESVDMNKIPKKFTKKFDFVWSACALEHLGSLQHGINFILNSVKCLKPGGTAIHTTEFNLSSNDDTFESEGCSIYRAKDIIKLKVKLENEGYEVEPLNFHTGSSEVDQYIDLPPYGFSPHMKLMLESYVVTSIGIIIKNPIIK